MFKKEKKGFLSFEKFQDLIKEREQTEQENKNFLNQLEIYF